MERLLAALRDAHDLSRMLRFAGVGFATTTLDIVLFAALTAAQIPPVSANIASYSCGIMLSYTLNRRWTYGRKASRRQGVKFALATASGLVLSTLLLSILTHLLPPLWAKSATLPVVFLWNYHSTRLWVFRDSTAESPTSAMASEESRRTFGRADAGGTSAATLHSKYHH